MTRVNFILTLDDQEEDVTFGKKIYFPFTVLLFIDSTIVSVINVLKERKKVQTRKSKSSNEAQVVTVTSSDSLGLIVKQLHEELVEGNFAILYNSFCKLRSFVTYKCLFPLHQLTE